MRLSPVRGKVSQGTGKEKSHLDGGNCVCKGLNWGKGIEENQCDMDAVSSGHCGKLEK